MNVSEFIDRFNSKKDLEPVAAENGDKSPSLMGGGGRAGTP
jgi:hypothetical protein